MARMAATIRPVNQTLLMIGFLLTLAWGQKEQPSSIRFKPKPSSLLELDIETT